MKALNDSKEIQVNDIPIILFLSVFDGVLQKFSYRFQDFERISDTTRLVAFPHLVETETAPLNLQMELVELKNDEQFVKKFKDEEDLLDTWRVAVKYPNLQELARKTLVLFGNTYVCEAEFLRMKYFKNKYRTRLSDSNLECGLRLMISSEPPNFVFVFVLFYLPYLSSIHEKANCIAILWTVSPHSLGSCLFSRFMGHLSST